MSVPTVSWDETSPAGSDNISQGDDRIRELKTQIREIINVDHDFPSSGQAADNGQHKQVTLQEQADLGTGAAGATILGSQTVSGKGELVYTDEDDNDVQITSGGKIKAESIAGVYPAADLAAIATIMDKIYPIGHIYISYVSTNPGTLLGIGTWTAFAAGKMLVGLDSGDADFDSVSDTGGSKTVTLTTTELPAHTHTVGLNNGTPGGTSVPEIATATGTSATITSSSTGTGSAFSIMNPYVVVYMWRRTA